MTLRYELEQIAIDLENWRAGRGVSTLEFVVRLREQIARLPEAEKPAEPARAPSAMRRASVVLNSVMDYDRRHPRSFSPPNGQEAREWRNIILECAHAHMNLADRLAESVPGGAEEGAFNAGGLTRHPSKVAAYMPVVAGRCPACGGATLFLGKGGYVTCSYLPCPNPSAANAALSGAAASGAGESTLEAVFAEVATWARATFPGQTEESIAEHLRREAQELAGNPADAEELADVLMLAADLADLLGVNPAQIMARKLAKCRARKWGAPDTQGVHEHVRSAPPAPAPSAEGDEQVPVQLSLFRRLTRTSRAALALDDAHLRHGLISQEFAKALAELIATLPTPVERLASVLRGIGLEAEPLPGPKEPEAEERARSLSATLERGDTWWLRKAEAEQGATVGAGGPPSRRCLCCHLLNPGSDLCPATESGKHLMGAEEQHDEDCACAGDHVPHAPDCANCDCGMAERTAAIDSCPDVAEFKEVIRAIAKEAAREEVASALSRLMKPAPQEHVAPDTSGTRRKP